MIGVDAVLAPLVEERWGSGAVRPMFTGRSGR